MRRSAPRALTARPGRYTTWLRSTSWRTVGATSSYSPMRESREALSARRPLILRTMTRARHHVAIVVGAVRVHVPALAAFEARGSLARNFRSRRRHRISRFFGNRRTRYSIVLSGGTGGRSRPRRDRVRRRDAARRRESSGCRWCAGQQSGRNVRRSFGRGSRVGLRCARSRRARSIPRRRRARWNARSGATN